MAALCWLHLSDWHQKGEDFDRRVVRDKLIEDIRNRTQIDPSLAQIDFIIFSGDVAFSGKEAEYRAAKEQLFDLVLQVTGLKSTPDRLFIVPGNHDLNRDRVYTLLPTELHKPFSSDDQIQKYLKDEELRELLLKPFKAFGQFVSKHAGQQPPDFANTREWTIGDKKVALLGLNSAWMCGRRDEKDQVNDDGSVLVGEPQIYDALKKVKDADIKIVVLHHPFDWLNRFERKNIERWLKSNFHFILHGHAHEQDVQRTQDTSGDYVIVPAGAIYDRRKTEELRHINAYNFVRLDSNQGIVYLRQWHDVLNEWQQHQIYPNGKFEFTLPKGLGQELSSTDPATAKSTPAKPDADAGRHQVIEQRYRDLLLETCDIINLANLPEQDRHLVQRQLELRRLYVPLRSWVEAPISEEAQVKLWEALEERRAASMHDDVKKREHTERKRVPVGERLKEAKRLVILGDPGAGKTTLTRWIATAYLLRLKNDPDWQALPDIKTLPDQPLLPIIIRCRELDANCLNGTLDDILQYTLRKAELGEADAATLRQILIARLKDGKALLMLDGLDEITDSTVRACFCQQLEKIVVAYSNAPIIATCRIVGYREMGYRLGRGFEHLTLADLERKEKDDFARRWCELTELPERRADAIKELIHDIHSNDRIERLTGNPMLLTTMALVKRKVGKLPGRRAELYWEAVQVLLNWRREVDEPLDVRETIPQLEYLAYAMCDRGVQQLRQDEVLELFGRMRDEYPKVHAARNRSPEEFLKRLEERTGIMVEAGHTRHLGMLVPVYEFRHLTFQEYLAARALVDKRFPGRDPNRSLAEHVAPLAGRTAETSFSEEGPTELAVVESWREALRLCTAICSDDDVDQILLAILTPQANETSGITRARAILAAQCLADEPNVSEQVSGQVLQALVGQIGEKEGDTSSKTGIEVTAVELARTRWVSRMCANLLNEFCQHAAGERERYGSIAGTVIMATVSQDVDNLDYWLKDQTKRIQSGDEIEVIGAALGIMELAYRGDAHLVIGLADSLLSKLKGSAPTAHAAAWALRWLNNSTTARKIWQPKADDIEYFVTTISNVNSDAGVVRNMALILAEEKIQQAVEPLIARLEDTNVDIRRTVARSLGSIESERAVGSLIARLEDSDADVRSAAAEALGDIKSERAVEPLIARLEDSDSDVLFAAAWALGKIESERAVEPLIAILEGGKADVRFASAWALGSFKSECIVEPLIALLKDSYATVRLAAARSLGKSKSERAIEPLIARLEDSDATDQSAAVSALVDIKSERTVELLIAKLEDSKADVRVAVIGALGDIKSERAVEPLIAILEDSKTDVRVAAVGALGDIKSERAVEPLIAILEDSNAGVRRATVTALGNIGSERVVTPLIIRLDDAEADVRYEAAQSLHKVYGDLGRPDDAIAAYLHVIEHDSNNVDLNYSLALSYRNSRQFTKAIEVCEHMLRVDPDNIEALNGLGYLNLQLGELTKAETSLHRALEVSPELAIALLNMGIVKWRTGTPDEARLFFHKALTVIAKSKEKDTATEGWLYIVNGEAEEGLLKIQSGKLTHLGDIYNLIDWTSAFLLAPNPPQGLDQALQLAQEALNKFKNGSSRK